MSILPHHTSDQVCAYCEQKLSLAHPELASWFREKIKPCFINVHVAWSFRDQIDQDQAFSTGHSNLKYPDSPHNKTPAMALDLFEIDQTGKAVWNKQTFSLINQLCEKTCPNIFWGGKWRRLGDFDHFEFVLTLGTSDHASEAS